MKLTKETEAELLKAYYHFWDANLSADMERFGSYLVDDFSAIGSANGEVFFSKHDAVKFYTATADEMRGKAELRNRSVSVQPLDINSVIVREESDLYVLIGEEWTFYGHARISCIVKHVDGSWKAVHQHASFPDHRTEEGQQLAAEKIEKENLELREAVKRRTAELEHKTRDLEIESCLERVRAVAMGMRKPDDMLDVCRTIARQLELLKVKEIRNVQTAIIYESKGTYLNYEYYVKHDKLLTTEVNYNLHPEHATFVNKMLESPDAFYTQGFTGKELKDWYAYQKTTPQFADSYLEQATSLNYYMYSIGGVVLGMSTYAPLSEEEITLFKRFRNVFDLAYRRFVDIEKAEAQAREAQIEAGLERVRSRSLAMHKTSELQEVIHTVHKELLTLNIAIAGGSFIAINSEVDTELRCWGSGGTADTSTEVHLPRYDKPFLANLIKGIKSGAGFFTEEYTQQEKKEFFTFLFKHEPWSALDFKQKIETLESPGGYTRSCYASQYTSIFIINHFGDKFSEADDDILKRFAKVFEQTYTRFLDLQNAEAQAREAKIEAALERVRSRAMGMRSSEELNELIGTVFTELTKLDFVLTRCLIMIYDPATNNCRWWMANSEDPDHPMNFLIQAHDHEPNLVYIEGWKARKVKSTYELKGTVKKKWDGFLFSETELSRLPDFVIAGMKEPERVFLNASFNTFGNLTLATLEPLPDQHFETMLRFAKVFDLTYTRFNDLKQAEEQAREAKIEAALERVRAKTMSMQHSDELIDAATVLFHQIEKLGAPSWNCSFNIWTEDKKEAVAWNATKDGFGRPFHTPSSEDVFLEFYEAAQRGEELYVKEIGGKELELHYNYLGTLPGVGTTLAELKAAGIVLPTFQVFHITYFSHGYLMFITYEPVPQLWDTFKRFAKVFEQTYTRFLDLQKAEAQARESQIQLALERVRARTMAMQHSDELAEASFLLDSQVRALGIKTQGCAFNIYGETDSTEWFSSEMGAMPPYKTPRENLFLRYYKAGEKGESIHIEEFAGEACIKHYEYLSTVPGMGDGIREMLKAGGSLPERQIDHAVYFKYGYLLFLTLEPVPEAHETFIRFAKVFEQTYTRFLDLQKAEAQAKEAKIEAALEKVRSGSLAMHKSDEIGEVVWVVVDKMKELNIAVQGISLVTFIPNSKDVLHWHANAEHVGAATTMLLPYFDDVILNDCYQAKEDSMELLVKVYSKEEKNRYFNYAVEHSDFRSIPEELKQWVREQPYLVFSYAIQNHSGIFLEDYTGKLFSKEENDILIRFSRVFEQSYVRFLDLQKAEAQALRAEQDLIEIKAARKKAEETLNELQLTQKQLIQSEKMASLGELTAGIAHEIQNPLNFVNNFSDVSTELVAEMNHEIEKGNVEEAKQLAQDLKQNLEKINHDGKRAGDIVKGMLQHSRTSSGQKELTDINALADEYLRLAYHGLKAKDKTFNAKFETNLDVTLPKVNVVPQDIGRVILNLINNAFYAVSERNTLRQAQGDNTYKPTVIINTKLLTDRIEIRVSDNGNGIPEKIKDKIFQPFFTTKPTGQGTGLGLSLSYDIIKAHGGALQVESETGVGTRFTIQLILESK